MTYLFPCKPNRMSPNSSRFDRLDNDIRWVAELKKNGWRCLPSMTDELILWTRHGTKIEDPKRTSDIREALAGLPPGTYLDGELTWGKRVKDAPTKLWLFDVITWAGESVAHLPLRERRALLKTIVETFIDSSDVEIMPWVEVGKKRFYEIAMDDALNEGIVMKRLDSKYIVSKTSCKQNPHWIKVKRPDDHTLIEK